MSDLEEILRKIKSENDPILKAKYIKYLVKEKNLKIKDIANHLKTSSSYICHLNRLNNLPEIVIDGYYSNLISLTHLFIISRVKDQNKIIGLYEKILTNNLTIIDTENELCQILYSVKHQGEAISNEERDKVINKIKKIIPEAKVKILQTKTKLKLEIVIFDNLKKTSLSLKKIKKIFSEGTLAKDY